VKVVYRRWSTGRVEVATSLDDVPRGADIIRVDRSNRRRSFEDAVWRPRRRSTDRNGDGA